MSYWVVLAVFRGNEDYAVCMPIILAISYLSLLTFNLLNWLCSKLPTCKTKSPLYFLCLVVGTLSLVFDLTFGLLVLLLLGFMSNDESYDAKMYLVVGAQFLFCHMDDFIVEIWRF